MENISSKTVKQKIKLDFKDSKYATGRRKRSIAKVWVKKGSGNNFQITFAKEGKFKQIGNNQFLELNFGETISVINGKITNFKFKKIKF